jgi:hypothetical protein
MATAVDRLLEKLRVLYDGLPADEQQVLEAILRQSQAEGGEVSGYLATRRVMLPVGTGPFGFVSPSPVDPARAQ